MVAKLLLSFFLSFFSLFSLSALACLACLSKRVRGEERPSSSIQWSNCFLIPHPSHSLTPYLTSWPCLNNFHFTLYFQIATCSEEVPRPLTHLWPHSYLTFLFTLALLPHYPCSLSLSFARERDLSVISELTHLLFYTYRSNKYTHILSKQLFTLCNRKTRVRIRIMQTTMMKDLLFLSVLLLWKWLNEWMSRSSLGGWFHLCRSFLMSSSLSPFLLSPLSVSSWNVTIHSGWEFVQGVSFEWVWDVARTKARRGHWVYIIYFYSLLKRKRNKTRKEVERTDDRFESSEMFSQRSSCSRFGIPHRTYSFTCFSYFFSREHLGRLLIRVVLSTLLNLTW